MKSTKLGHNDNIFKLYHKGITDRQKIPEEYRKRMGATEMQEVYVPKKTKPFVDNELKR